MAENREVAFKNAINRTTSFNDVPLGGNAILKLEPNAYYKIFIRNNNFSAIFDILNLKIFSIDFVRTKNDIKYIFEGGYFYITDGGFNSTATMSIEYFDSFEYGPTTSDTKDFSSGYGECTETKIYYLQNVASPLIKADVADVKVAQTETLRTNKIIFGNWSFTVSTSGLTTTIAHTDKENSEVDDQGLIQEE